MESILNELWLIVDLCVAALLGFIIGFERKLRFKEAGIRTHTIVCVGSALIMVISKYAFKDDYDSARVAAQIVSGVGFLGAGMIVYRQNGVSGLTTAAGVWTTAGVGMACGGEMYALAGGATILIVVLQCLFHIDCPVFNRKKYFTIKISFLQTEDNDRVKEIFKTERFNHLVVKRMDGEIVYSAMLNTSTEFSSEQIKRIMEENPYILSIERCDNE